MGEVEDFINKMDPKLKPLVKRVHSIMEKTVPEAEAVIKWGKPTYLLKGENFTWIIPYRDHIDFGFFKGAMPESKLLEGTGKGLRHIKIWSKEEIKEREFARLLKEAKKMV